MKILIFDGSPKEKSDTIRLTDAFIEGLNEKKDNTIVKYKVINNDIKPCLGCFSCWNNNGKCIIKDDMEKILKDMLQSDIIIWSFPLYYFGLPSHLKALLDRTLALTKKSIVEVDGCFYHSFKDDIKDFKTIMICGSGFPYYKENFEAVIKQFQNSFHKDLTTITVSQTPMLNVKEANVVTDFLLKKFISAGREYYQTKKLSKETIEKLQKPMFPKDLYLKMANNQ
ncbi:flavodoxin family protein [Acholeplasma sp. OttesenSCG-928-E16]|nr:flavodoxin family protein [Acholeplasma sp. OttesenSCG-928-E16]